MLFKRKLGVLCDSPEGRTLRIARDNIFSVLSQLDGIALADQKNTFQVAWKIVQ